MVEGVGGEVGASEKNSFFSEDLDKRYNALLNRDQKVSSKLLHSHSQFSSLLVQPDSGLDCYYNSTYIDSLLGRLPCLFFFSFLFFSFWL